MNNYRGVIALDEAACTSCMVCVRECPTWCITLLAHQEQTEQAGRRPKVENLLDSFDIDYSLCMYCSICVDTCPHDALFWAPKPTPSSPDLVQNKEDLGEWLPLVEGR